MWLHKECILEIIHDLHNDRLGIFYTLTTWLCNLYNCHLTYFAKVFWAFSSTGKRGTHGYTPHASVGLATPVAPITSKYFCTFSYIWGTIGSTWRKFISDRGTLLRLHPSDRCRLLSCSHTFLNSKETLAGSVPGLQPADGQRQASPPPG